MQVSVYSCIFFNRDTYIIPPGNMERPPETSVWITGRCVSVPWTARRFPGGSSPGRIRIGSCCFAMEMPGVITVINTGTNIRVNTIVNSLFRLNFFILTLLSARTSPLLQTCAAQRPVTIRAPCDAVRTDPFATEVTFCQASQACDLVALRAEGCAFVAEIAVAMVTPADLIAGHHMSAFIAGDTVPCLEPDIGWGADPPQDSCKRKP